MSVHVQVPPTMRPGPARPSRHGPSARVADISVDEAVMFSSLSHRPRPLCVQHHYTNSGRPALQVR